MLSIRVICVGRLKEKFYTDAANEYLKRLAGYCKLEVVELPEHRPEIEAKLPPGASIVALCVEGREFDSHELSKLLTDCAGSGSPRLCFIIGGSDGLDDEIKNKADIKLSMSKMTFPHNLARVMLLEQLYRGFKIAEGGKYHK